MQPERSVGKREAGVATVQYTHNIGVHYSTVLESKRVSIDHSVLSCGTFARFTRMFWCFKSYHRSVASAE